MIMAIDKNEVKGRALRPSDTMAKAKAVLSEALTNGRVGALTVDPQYLVLQPYRSNNLEQSKFSFLNISTIFYLFNTNDNN